jgi:hypothetical protein
MATGNDIFSQNPAQRLEDIQTLPAQGMNLIEDEMNGFFDSDHE